MASQKCECSPLSPSLPVSAFSFYQIRREIKLKINRKQNQKCKIQLVGHRQLEATWPCCVPSGKYFASFSTYLLLLLLLLCSTHLFIVRKKTSRGKKKIKNSRGSESKTERGRARRQTHGRRWRLRVMLFSFSTISFWLWCCWCSCSLCFFYCLAGNNKKQQHFLANISGLNILFMCFYHNENRQ